MKEEEWNMGLLESASKSKKPSLLSRVDQLPRHTAKTQHQQARDGTSTPRLVDTIMRRLLHPTRPDLHYLWLYPTTKKQTRMFGILTGIVGKALLQHLQILGGQLRLGTWTTLFKVVLMRAPFNTSNSRSKTRVSIAARKLSRFIGANGIQ